MKAVLALLALAALIAPEGSTHWPPQPSAALTPAAATFGQPTEGFILSLQFSKDEFQEDEPVTAIVTTRNVSERQLSFVDSVPHYISFVVVDETGKKVLSREEIRLRDANEFQRRLAKIVNNPKYIDLAPNEQHSHSVDLRKMYDLPRGKYAVSASRIVPTMEDSRLKAGVMSGNAMFFGAGFSPQGEATYLQHQRTGTNGAAAATKKDVATPLPNPTGDEGQTPTKQPTSDSLPPQKAQNAEVTTPFGQAQGSNSAKFYYLLGAAALLLAAGVLIWRTLRRKPAV
jgi:hypothetical protein